MKLTETLQFTRHYYGPAGGITPSYSIDDHPIDVLLAHLKEQGIVINPESSEKVMSYPLRMSDHHTEIKNTLVPLAASFPPDATVQAFYLRDGNGLELHLSNYDSITGSSQELIGSPVSGDMGIVCKLTLEVSEIDLSVVGKVRDALEKTYISSFDPMRSILRDLEDALEH